VEAARFVELPARSGVQEVLFDLSPPPVLPDPEPEPQGFDAWPAALAFGIGGTGLALGLVAGALAASDEDAPTAELAGVATAGLALGVAGITTGAVLLVVRPGAPRAAAGVTIDGAF
jgi:hypothetical protein